jgi:ArsR family transcriptional regulator
MDVDVEPLLVETGKALAEPTRWRIVELLADEELCVCHLVEELGIAQPLVSHHLKVLRDAGLVESDRYRYWTYYHLRPESFAAASHDLLSIAERARQRGGERRRPCC